MASSISSEGQHSSSILCVWGYCRKSHGCKLLTADTTTAPKQWPGQPSKHHVTLVFSPIQNVAHTVVLNQVPQQPHGCPSWHIAENMMQSINKNTSHNLGCYAEITNRTGKSMHQPASAEPVCICPDTQVKNTHLKMYYHTTNTQLLVAEPCTTSSQTTPNKPCGGRRTATRPQGCNMW